MAEGTVSLRKAGLYSLYVLALLLLAYLLNQLDRYALAIVNKPVAQDLEYGDKSCLPNVTIVPAASGSTCENATSETRCEKITNQNGTILCEWNYNGQGYEYQLIAGPIFILVYTFMGIFLGMAADVYNRKVLLAICLIFWSLMTLLSGFVKTYWQLALLRFGLGIGEAGCTPFAASMIADYFDASLRASAMGVYNWGIYTGYSLSYAVGNFISTSLGWRWVFIICGIPGLILGLLILATVKEPQRKDENETIQNDEETKGHKFLEVLKPFARPSLVLLILGGSFRNSAGYIWAYNTQPYFTSIHQTPEQIGTYMSWIPLVAGSIGVVLGGFISDRFVKKLGTYGRVFVLVFSQLLAAPFAAGALFLSPPWAYLSLIPCNIIGEMWVGVTLTLLIELVPSNIKTSAVAVYMFIITNIGGNMPLLVPPLKNVFIKDGYTNSDALRGALYILYPGMYLVGSFFFLLSLLAMRHDIRKARRDEYASNYETEPKRS